MFRARVQGLHLPSSMYTAANWFEIMPSPVKAIALFTFNIYWPMDLIRAVTAGRWKTNKRHHQCALPGILVQIYCMLHSWTQFDAPILINSQLFLVL